MNIWEMLKVGYYPQINVLFMLLLNRIFFTALALSILTVVIMLTRKRLAPGFRSWLWGLCVPVLFIPFEHGVVAIARSFYTPESTQSNLLYAWELFHNLMCYVWLAGFIAFVVKMRKNRRNTMRLLRTKQLSGCATYFYKGRSHIYLPVDFEKTYTSIEREMLLAHEKQHIMQHDPFLYRFLQTIQCVFWFNPLVHIASRLIRHDRELLCDERVVSGRSGREYGMLLLREAQKAPTGSMLPGIVTEVGSVYERVAACVRPYSRNKKLAFIVAGIAAVVFAVGITGFIKPIIKKPMDIKVYTLQDGNIQWIEGAERFILLSPDGIALDQQGLHEYAVSIGLEPEQKLGIFALQAERMTLIGDYEVSGGGSFGIDALETDDVFFSYYDTGFRPFSVLYKLL